jgi:hypothetical protein
MDASGADGFTDGGGVFGVGVRLADEVKRRSGSLTLCPGVDEVEDAFARDPLPHAKGAHEAIVPNGWTAAAYKQAVEAGRNDADTGSGNAPIFEDGSSMFTDADEQIRAQQRLLELVFAGLGLRVRDPRQLVYHRHDRAFFTPAVETRSADDPGESIHDDHVEGRGIEEVRKAIHRPFLLLRGGSARDNLFDLQSHLPQPGEHLRMIEVSTGQTSRVPDGDEGYAQGRFAP